MTTKVLYSTEKYIVIVTDAALNEVGDACDARGYAVVNKDTSIVEHTTLVLPAAMFQADNFNRTLVSLLTEVPESPADAIEGLPEDVTVN